MQPDLTRPGAADAFEAAVSLAVEAATDPTEERVTRAGFAFAHFHQLVDGRNPKTHNELKAAVYQAAAEALLRSADLPDNA